MRRKNFRRNFIHTIQAILLINAYVFLSGTGIENIERNKGIESLSQMEIF